MVEIYLLEQLVALDACGTLVAASEKLHLTQPTLSRSMQKLEEEIGVPLFVRSNKKIAFNENGKLAVEYAKRILAEEEEMQRHLILQERSRHTISLGAIGPGPVLDLVPRFARLYPGRSVSAEVADEEQLRKGLEDGTYQLIVLNHVETEPDFFCTSCGSEQLYYCFDKTEYPTGESGVYFEDLNGKSIMMPEETGFWGELVKRELPDSLLIQQTDNETLNEISRNSSLPSFATDVGMKYAGERPGRIALPIMDASARAEYYIVCKKEKEKDYRKLFREFESEQ